MKKTGKGLVRHVLIRKGFTTKELMVCLVINGRKIPQVEKLVDRLQKIEGMTAIMANVNTEQTNVILGKEIQPIWGQDYIEDISEMSNTAFPRCLSIRSTRYRPKSFTEKHWNTPN